MSLTDFASIDLVARVPGDPRRVMLLIYDKGEYADDIERECALQRKLSAYLLFVETGQFAETYPALANAKLSVEVVCLIAPTARMKLIESVHSANHSGFFLPVNVSEEAEFRSKWGLSEAKAR
ncbi:MULTISPECIES: DUF6572 domain-containing protein [Methylosinus]|uniref:DUF6572 domain-containing protein n=1 Tax=Methylosinus TaxID=425 RepID=UPI0012DC2481|nr:MULTISPECIES: DUF6572 domain-containing protein [Methylosinus]